ncbi:SMI1/KNR4 family protein [Saccharibacillus deserti]|uniref:SMI1/KNR4 family protein n=1 Tax=Saccharibacillus deserti TaxID=1634444 RepID=UPI001552B4C0|nr:SMI1/KNR4 family protein [Saccharibacillus deserti]
MEPDYPIFCEDCEPPIGEPDFAELERRFGFEFPAAFKAHYLQFNGGYLPEAQMERQRIAFGGFEPIRYGELPAERLYMDLLESFPQLPGLFPFAYDQGGSCFLIGLQPGMYRHRIYIFLMDGEELVPVEDSFERFMMLLGEA